jgi:hypothetical protein
MVRSKAFFLLACAALLTPYGARIEAQASSDATSAAPFVGTPVPPPVEPRPFSVKKTGGETVEAIEFRPSAGIAESDRLLVADSEASIKEHAAFAGLDFDNTNWTYQQIVCPALPNHLFLQFMRNNGVGDVTVFSASIPRTGDGRVRIVPILRRGYSLWSPAPINALTISAFNHIRAEELRAQDPTSKNGEWLGNGLCYAALAGAHPQIVDRGAAPALNRPVPALRAVMDVNTSEKNREVIRFADAAALPQPMEWTMTFTGDGRLVKATHSPAPMATVQQVSQQPTFVKTLSVPQN